MSIPVSGCRRSVPPDSNTSSATPLQASEMKSDPEKNFWNWFQAHRDEYRSLNSKSAQEKERLLSEIHEHLREYHHGLAYEISEPLREGGNEFVVSADGDLEIFSHVRSLVAAAPQLPGWKVIAFRPAQGFTFVHKFDDVKLEASTLWFQPLVSKSNPGSLGLMMGVPDLKDEQKDAVVNSLWIVVETGIGEERCAERIKYVDATKLPDNPDASGFLPLAELPDYLRWFEGKTQKKE
ncbi:hypothetical protein [Planctomicrobium piriforme]|uniref:hypothetical protein n=1 Tax=Planctomicrobium piriforme TaxID=1576369 RepID=UPI001113DBCF|nr:hypothetical protein [Planctomicrobium piriforme]